MPRIGCFYLGDKKRIVRKNAVLEVEHALFIVLVQHADSLVETQGVLGKRVVTRLCVDRCCHEKCEYRNCNSTV